MGYYQASGTYYYLYVILVLFAVAWIIGVYRLRGDTERIMVIGLLRVLVIIIRGSFFVISIGSIFAPSLFTIFQPFLDILSYPLVIAFLGNDWGLGLGIAINLMTICMTVLWQISDKVNLSRAAQETHHVQAQRVAFRLGDFDRINEMNDRKRLGSMHVPSKIPSFLGSWIVT